MNVSICITVKNEEESIGRLLDSLLAQSKRANEIVIVDGGSSDKTLEIIGHYQKRFSNLKLLKEKVSRAKGRNLGIEVARNEIVVLTDAGCVARRDWLKNITAPFENPEVEVVAGFYHMVASFAYQKVASFAYKMTTFEKAETVFLGVSPDKFDVTFLPSTRSIAFRKSTWESIGGFSEKLTDTAEDTTFNFKILKTGVKIVRVKNAIVEWGMPKDLTEFFWKVFSYAKGDVKTKIVIFPTKGLTSHNIKAFLVLLRYLVGITLLIFSFYITPLFSFLILLVLTYFIWAYRKAGFWGVVLQITSDFAVMSGFLTGLLRK